MAQVRIRVRQRPDAGVHYEVATWQQMLARPPKEWIIAGKTYPVKGITMEGFRGQSIACLELDVPEDELWGLVQEPARRGRPPKED
jgi:hypothetical protein